MVYETNLNCEDYRNDCELWLDYLKWAHASEFLGTEHMSAIYQLALTQTKAGHRDVLVQGFAQLKIKV